MSSLEFFRTMHRRLNRVNKQDDSRPKQSIVKFFTCGYQEMEVHRLLRKFYRAMFYNQSRAAELKDKIQHAMQKMRPEDKLEIASLLSRSESIANAKLTLKLYEADIERLEKRIFLVPHKPQINDSAQYLEREAAHQLYHRYQQCLEKLNHINGELSSRLQQKKDYFVAAQKVLQSKFSLTDVMQTNLKTSPIDISIEGEEVVDWGHLKENPEAFTEKHMEEKMRSFRFWFKPSRLIESVLAQFEKTIQLDEKLLGQKFDESQMKVLYENELHRYFKTLSSKRLEKIYSNFNCKAYKKFIASLDFYINDGNEQEIINRIKKDYSGLSMIMSDDEFDKLVKNRASAIMGKLKIIANLKDRLQGLVDCLYGELAARKINVDTITIEPITDETLISSRNRKIINNFVDQVVSHKHKHWKQFYPNSSDSEKIENREEKSESCSSGMVNIR